MLQPDSYVSNESIRLPAIDALAAGDSSGQLWLALVNVEPKRAARIAATIDGVTARSASGEVLTAATVDAHNSFDRPDDVAPRPFAGRASEGALLFELPPKSMAVVGVR